MATEEVIVLTEARKLSWEDRLAHKLWKARNEAYQDIAAICKETYDPKDARLKEFGPLLKKAISDSNAAAQEKALEALIAFQLAADSDSGRYAKETCDAIVGKCLTGRTRTVERSMTALLYWIELEAIETVLESLEKGLKSKIAKVVVSCIDVMYEALRDFGARVVPVKRVLKLLPDLFSHADGKVREVAKGLTIETCRWVGKDVVKRVLFEGLRDATKLELESHLESVTTHPAPSRFLRSEQERVTHEEAVQPTPGDPFVDKAVEGPTQVDEYDLVEPVDILTPLTKSNFWDGIKASKWSDRRDAVAELTALAATIKIAAGDFSEISRSLKKLITDVNIAVAMEAIQATASLAKGLRKDFTSSARLLLPTLLEKFKERKPMVVSAVREALQAMFMGGSVIFLEMLEDVKVAVKNKVPSVRAETLSWVASCIEASKPAVIIKMQKDFVPILMESLQDGTVEVREAAFSALAAIATRVGMKPLERAVEKLDDVRKKKLQDIIATTANGTHDEAETAAAPTLASAAGNGVGHSKTAFVRGSAASLLASKKPSSRKVVGTANAAPGKGPAASSKAPGKAAPTPAPVQEDVEPEDMSQETLEERAGHLIKPEILLNLKSSNWKERLEAMLSTKEIVEALTDELAPNTELLVRLVSKLPGWGDKNVQVVQKVIEVITFLAERSSTFSKKCAVICVAGLFERAGDIKTRVQAFSCLSAICEAVGPQFMYSRAYKILKDTKNPKVLTEGINWMATALDEFGIENVKLKDLVDFLKEAGLASSTAACRSSTFKVIGVLHRYVGPDIKAHFSDVKAALMAPIDAECEKNKFEGPAPAPKRIVKETAASSQANGVETGVPYEDISPLITPMLVEELGSADWKVRQQSIEVVSKLLEHRRIQPTGTGELMGALKARLGDSNKNLVAMTLGVLASLAVAMGPAIEKNSRGVMADVLRCMSDNKKQTREAVVRTLDTWQQVIGLEKLLPVLAGACMDPKLSADGRKDLFDWLTRATPSTSEPEELLQMLKAIASGLQDKSAEVRKAAEGSLTEIVKVCGFDLVARAVRSDALSKSQALLGPTIEKLRPAVMESAQLPTAPHLKGSKAFAPAATRPSSARNLVTQGRPATVGKVAKPGEAAPSPGLLSQPLLNLRESSKEERERAMPRNAKLKFEEPRLDQAQELEAEMAKYFREDVLRRLCSRDFKQQVEALEMLQKAIPDSLRLYEEVLDLLLRWSVLRLCECNTTGLLKLLEFLRDLVEGLKTDGYVLTDFEANVFLPCFVEKMGHNIEKVREKMQELTRLLSSVYPVSKLQAFLADGLRSKNNRTRIECVQHLEALLERHGVEILGGSKTTLGAMAALTSERDSETRKAALNAMATVYKILGNDIWRYMGRLSDAQQSMLEEKFKRTARELDRERDQESYMAASQATTAGARAGHLEVAREQLATQFSGSDVSSLQQDQGGADVSLDLASGVEPMAPPFYEGGEPGALSLAQEWQEALRFIAQQKDLEAVVEGLKFIYQEVGQIVNGEEDPDYLRRCNVDIDKLVSTLAGQVNLCFSMGADPSQSPRPCKYLLNALLHLFEVRELASAVSGNALRLMMVELLCWLLDARGDSNGTGQGLKKAVNVLMLRILNNADQTLAFLTLMDMLRPHSKREESLAQQSPALPGLVIKCLLRLTRELKTRHVEIDLDRLLQAIHEFLEELPLEERSLSKQGAGDTDKAYRMVKTILFNLISAVGPNIKGHLSLVPIDKKPAPAILHIIDFNLETLRTNEGKEDNAFASSAGEPERPVYSENLEGDLAAVFRKIRDKETCVEGFEALHDFTRHYPEVDVFGVHLRSASAQFQDYVRSNLAEVAALHARAPPGGSGSGAPGALPARTPGASSRADGSERAVRTPMAVRPTNLQTEGLGPPGSSGPLAGVSGGKGSALKEKDAVWQGDAAVPEPSLSSHGNSTVDGIKMRMSRLQIPMSSLPPEAQAYSTVDPSYQETWRGESQAQALRARMSRLKGGNLGQ